MRFKKGVTFKTNLLPVTCKCLRDKIYPITYKITYGKITLLEINLEKNFTNEPLRIQRFIS